MTQASDIASFEQGQIEEENQVLHTTCKNCVFSVVEGRTQTGCKLKRIEAYKKLGTTVIEAEDLEENEFFVIESWCNGYREKEWLLTIPEDTDDLEAVRKEILPRLGFFVLVNEENSDVKKTIESVIKAKASYVVVVNNSKKDYVDLIEECQSYVENCDLTLKVMNLIEEVNEYEAIDEAFGNAQSGYYSVIVSGEEAREDILERLDVAINENLTRVGYVKPYDGVNGMTVLSLMHKHLNGNVNGFLEEKVIGAAKMDNSSNLVQSWETI